MSTIREQAEQVYKDLMNAAEPPDHDKDIATIEAALHEREVATWEAAAQYVRDMYWRALNDVADALAAKAKEARDA